MADTSLSDDGSPSPDTKRKIALKDRLRKGILDEYRAVKDGLDTFTKSVGEYGSDSEEDDEPDEDVDSHALNKLYEKFLDKIKLNVDTEFNDANIAWLKGEGEYKSLDINSRNYINKLLEDHKNIPGEPPGKVQNRMTFIQKAKDKITTWRNGRLNKNLQKFYKENVGHSPETFWVRQVLYHLPPATIVPKTKEHKDFAGRDFIEVNDSKLSNRGKCSAADTQCPGFGRPKITDQTKLVKKKIGKGTVYKDKLSDMDTNAKITAELDRFYDPKYRVPALPTDPDGTPGDVVAEPPSEDIAKGAIGVRDINKHICYICGLPIVTPQAITISKLLEADLNCEHIIPCGPLSLLTGLNCPSWDNRVKDYIEEQKVRQQNMYKIINKLTPGIDVKCVSQLLVQANKTKLGDWNHNKYLCELYQDHQLGGKYPLSMSYDAIYDKWKDISQDILSVCMESAHGICNGRKGNDPWPLIVKNHGRLQTMMYEESTGTENKLKVHILKDGGGLEEVNIDEASRRGYGMNIAYNRNDVLTCLHKIMIDGGTASATKKNICRRNNIHPDSDGVRKVCYIDPNDNKKIISYDGLFAYLVGKGKLDEGDMDEVKIWIAFNEYIYSRGVATPKLLKAKKARYCEKIPMGIKKNGEAKFAECELVDKSGLMFISKEQATEKCIKEVDGIKTILPIEWILEREKVIYSYAKRIVRTLFKYKQIDLCQHAWLSRRGFCLSYYKLYDRLPSAKSPYTNRSNVPLISRGLIVEPHHKILKKMEKAQRRFWWDKTRVLPKGHIDTNPGAPVGSLLKKPQGGGASREEEPAAEGGPGAETLPGVWTGDDGLNTKNINNFDELVWILINSTDPVTISRSGLGEGGEDEDEDDEDDEEEVIDLQNNMILNMIASDNTIDNTIYLEEEGAAAEEIPEGWKGNGSRECFRFFDEKLTEDPVIQEWIAHQSMVGKIKTELLETMLEPPEEDAAEAGAAAPEDEERALAIIDEELELGLLENSLVFEDSEDHDPTVPTYQDKKDYTYNYLFNLEDKDLSEDGVDILFNQARLIQTGTIDNKAIDPNDTSIATMMNMHYRFKIDETRFNPLHTLYGEDELFNEVLRRLPTIPMEREMSDEEKRKFIEYLQTEDDIRTLRYPADMNVISPGEINSYIHSKKIMIIPRGIDREDPRWKKHGDKDHIYRMAFNYYNEALDYLKSDPGKHKLFVLHFTHQVDEYNRLINDKSEEDTMKDLLDTPTFTTLFNLFHDVSEIASRDGRGDVGKNMLGQVLTREKVYEYIKHYALYIKSVGAEDKSKKAEKRIYKKRPQSRKKKKCRCPRTRRKTRKTKRTKRKHRRNTCRTRTRRRRTRRNTRRRTRRNTRRRTRNTRRNIRRGERRTLRKGIRKSIRRSIGRSINRRNSRR